VVAKRDWSIQFETGKSSFTPAAEATLTDLYNQLTVGSLSVQIEGHTDNVGSPDKNKALSEARAFAVKNWLQEKAPTLFPANRINVRAYGDASPVASNATPEGRAKNRRVTIILGTKS
jgi:OOP family OmpA-OmpF porin